MTSELGDEALDLRRFLLRTGTDIGRRLSLQADQALERKDRKRSYPLCSQLKAFGHCREYLVCSDRHTVVETLDSNEATDEYQLLPTDGTVKVNFNSFLLKYLLVSVASCAFFRLCRFKFDTLSRRTASLLVCSST